MVTLETVEAPGYAEAVRHENRVRDTAFLEGLELVCGVEVVPLSLRRLIWLEQARNGFVVPWRFESQTEYLAHALQLVYFCRPEYRPPGTPRVGFWGSFWEGRKQYLFSRRVLRVAPAEEITKEIIEWHDSAFMDAPSGDTQAVRRASHASFPAYLVDKFGEAGLTFTYDQIMDMPLRRLWQHWRIAERRINGVKLTNPSDEILTQAVAGGGK